ncbi:MAG TPA: hypothetical protein PLX18_11045 [Anaerohalosphaeraceae bacterium]|nr:hypothetical protein [Anaerohalosphaeraceae bacterium]HQI08376.1 hypothetical protein [Anaerohalosphaeraceae bacterium]
MQIIVKETYRGQHGLLIAGHPYDLTEGQIDAIEEELALQNRVFRYERLRDNRQAKTKEIEDYPNKEQKRGRTK